LVSWVVLWSRVGFAYMVRELCGVGGLDGPVHHIASDLVHEFVGLGGGVDRDGPAVLRFDRGSGLGFDGAHSAGGVGDGWWVGLRDV
jgi:hypothetical protein